jgi:iron complex transport system ATP-binding protein
VNPSLRFEDAAVGYGDRIVLEGVSLAVHGGEILAVVGPNGVGKSTLVKAASGVLSPMGGRIYLGGEDLNRLSPPQRARRVGVVPQASQVPESFSASEVVLMGRTPYLGWLSRESRSDLDIARGAMERTATVELGDRLMGELSGGERQRVMIARALAQTPSVLLLDEPTAHLDLRHQDDVLALVRALAVEEGLAVLITLHDLNLVGRFANRVALLSNARVRKVGEPEEVLTPDELEAVYGIRIHVTSHPIHGTPLVLS